MRDWQWLPAELLTLIGARLPLHDMMLATMSCKNCQASLPLGRAACSRAEGLLLPGVSTLRRGVSTLRRGVSTPARAQGTSPLSPLPHLAPSLGAKTTQHMSKHSGIALSLFISSPQWPLTQRNTRHHSLLSKCAPHPHSCSGVTQLSHRIDDATCLEARQHSTAGWTGLLRAAASRLPPSARHAELCISSYLLRPVSLRDHLEAVAHMTQLTSLTILQVSGHVLRPSVCSATDCDLSKPPLGPVEGVTGL